MDFINLVMISVVMLTEVSLVVLLVTFFFFLILVLKVSVIIFANDSSK